MSSKSSSGVNSGLLKFAHAPNGCNSPGFIEGDGICDKRVGGLRLHVEVGENVGGKVLQILRHKHDGLCFDGSRHDVAIVRIGDVSGGRQEIFKVRNHRVFECRFHAGACPPGARRCIGDPLAVQDFRDGSFGFVENPA